MSRSKKKGMGPVIRTGESSDSMVEDDSEEELDSDDEAFNHSEDEQDMDDSGRLRMRADISLGPDYAGKRSSRKNAIGADDSDEDEDDPEQRSLDDKLQSLYTDGSSDEEDNALKNWQMSSGKEDELEALSREYEKLREQEMEVRETLKGEENENHKKGQAVQNQKAVWDRALEVRISLQKVLSGANRLPKKQAKLALSANKELEKAYSSLTDSAALTLNCLVDLEKALIEGNSGIDEVYSNTANGNGKRKAVKDPEEMGLDGGDNAWQEVDQVYSRIAPFRDNALDRWQRKVQLNAGAVSKGKLRAFNQSISQQIATAMRDTSRLIDGMRLKNSSLRILGQPLENGAVESATDNTIVEVQGERDPETFDDSEFYQNLLHEFLESSDPMGQAGRDLMALKRRTKNRKVVDRRASKGRKIRYNVMEPLLNFMAPSPMEIPPMTNKLFANVFGQQKVEHHLRT